MRKPSLLVVLFFTSWTIHADVPGFGDYRYDGAGNIIEAASELYFYDVLGRLQRATIGDRVQEFDYDRYGNIRRIITDGDLEHAIRPGVDAETNWADLTHDPQTGQPNNMLTLHDAAGNVEVSPNASFQYDALHVVKASTVGGVSRLHIYSASDERIGTIGAFGTDWTIRDNAGRVLRRLSTDTSGNWRWLEDYIYGANARVLAAEVPTQEKVRHFHLDHLGTPRLTTGNGGAEIARRSYAPFGAELTPSATERLQFTGHERDAPSLDYMHARYYEPLMGRFLSVDPVLAQKAALKAPQMWNRYAYVHNNPVNRIDPDGRLAYHWHYLITYLAARESGMSRRESMSLAWRVVKVDHREGSQSKSEWASNLHAMRGTKTDGRTQTIKEGRDGTQASIAGSIYFSDLAGAIHTAQDRAAPMHADKAWKGAGLNTTTILHLKGDIAPESITIGMAYVNTLNVIKAYREGDLSPAVYSGTTVDEP